MTDDKPKFIPGPWGYIEPPAPGELPLVMPHGDRYSVILTARTGKYTERFGELYSVCCIDADAQFFRERVHATAALIAQAPKMLNALKKCLEYLKRCPFTRNAELEKEIETTLEEATK